MRNPKYYDKNPIRENLKFESKVVRGAAGCDPATGAISFPIYQTASFAHHTIDDTWGYNYSRCINPTREEVERTMCMLEEGSRAFAVSSGMAAITLVFALLKPNDHLIFSDDIYGGTFRSVDRVLVVNGVEYDSIDLGDLTLLEQTIKPNTKMILIETPSNPTMKIADIEKISQIAKKHNILVVVDNTLMTPYYQKPLTLGADIVLHSGTKYLAGHNDVICGIVIVKDDEIGERLELQMYIDGAGLAPMDSWLLLRGLKTLVLRMEKHTTNAHKVVDWIRTQPKIKKVYYAGKGGLISFEVDSMETVNALLERLQLIIFAESLGGTETLITHPITRTHTEITEEKKELLGITDTLLRISVGIEDADDLIMDLAQALE